MKSPSASSAFVPSVPLTSTRPITTANGTNCRPALRPRAVPHHHTAVTHASPRACASSSPSPSPSPTPLLAYTRYLTDIAKMSPPPYLNGVLHVLSAIHSGTPRPPHVRTGLHPFLIPLSTLPSGDVVGLLRWPTPPPDMQIPLVRAAPDSLSLTLLANSCSDYVNRAVAAADFAGNHSARDGIRAACDLAVAYQDGAVTETGLGLERYTLLKIAPFADVYEGLAAFHFAKDDHRSGLVACERHAAVFPGWARAHVFHARSLVELGREAEAKDAARFGLQMPLWTAGEGGVKELAKIAGYVEDDSLGKIYRRLYEDTRENEIAEGKAPAQVALDRAAYLLDVVVAEGGSSWTEEVCEGIAELYGDAGLSDVASFVRLAY